MQVHDTPLPDVKLLETKRFRDERGWFAEGFNRRAHEESGLPGVYVQDNQSWSKHGVLRGLHYQVVRPQTKLVRVLSGHIWDVAVDLRPGSPAFGQYAGFDLKAPSGEESIDMLLIPGGFAHGFVVLSESAEVLYKTTDYYEPSGERCVVWNDPTLAIAWPLDKLVGPPILNAKDAQGRNFLDADLPK